MPIFRFSQIEVAWPLGPPDGRYLVKTWGLGPDSPPTHVLVFATEGTIKRGRLQRSKRRAEPEPEPTPVATGRATVISAAAPFADVDAARAWLTGAGEAELAEDLRALNRVLHAHRVVTADPHLRTIPRSELLVARIGYGDGDQVAYGRWSDARELIARERHQRRTKVLEPQARLAQVLSQKLQVLVCEELVLRSRLDFDSGRTREAALQLKIGLDAALAELSADDAHDMDTRLRELAEHLDPVQRAANSALTGRLTETELEAVKTALGRCEAALRARAVARA